MRHKLSFASLDASSTKVAPRESWASFPAGGDTKCRGTGHPFPNQEADIVVPVGCRLFMECIQNCLLSLVKVGNFSPIVIALEYVVG